MRHIGYFCFFCFTLLLFPIGIPLTVLTLILWTRSTDRRPRQQQQQQQQQKVIVIDRRDGNVDDQWDDFIEKNRVR